MFSIKIDIPNMSGNSEIRFEYSLNSLHGAFTAKTPPRDPSLPWNGAFYKECVEEFQIFTIKIDYKKEICLQVSRSDFRTA